MSDEDATSKNLPALVSVNLPAVIADDPAPEPARRYRLRDIGIGLLLFAAIGSAVGVFAATGPYSNTVGNGQSSGMPDATVDAAAWESLSGLGQGIDFSGFVSRKRLDEALGAAFEAARQNTDNSSADFEITGYEAEASGPDLRLTLHGRVGSKLFGAGMATAATLDPRYDGARIVFDAAPAGAVAPESLTTDPATAAGYDRLRSSMAAIVHDLVLPISLPVAATDSGRKAKPTTGIAAAFMFDEGGLHMIGRLPAALPPPDDDDLLTGSLGSAGLTGEHYRAAFLAARSRFLPGPDPQADAELALTRASVARLLDEAAPRACAPVALETEAVTVSGPIRLADPPASPQCRRIAETCTARDLCTRESECQDRIVERTIEETVKVPVRREVCGRREYVCYAWGPYGCAWGQRVCIAPRRVTEFKDKVVQRVVAESQASDAPACENLRALKAEQPGICGQISSRQAPNCSLVAGASGVADCEGRAAILDRMRDKPTAMASIRIVGRGRVEACTAGALSEDLGSATLTTSVAGKVEIVAEVTIRPDGRSDTDALRCAIEPAAAVKGTARVKAERSRQATVGMTGGPGTSLAVDAGTDSIAIPLDKAVMESLFGGKAGLTYRCTVQGAEGAGFAQWESRIAPSLKEVAAKTARLVATVQFPRYQPGLPEVTLLGRSAPVVMSEGMAVFRAVP